MPEPEDRADAKINERLMAGEKRAMTRIALRIEAESSPLAPANRFSS